MHAARDLAPFVRHEPQARQRHGAVRNAHAPRLRRASLLRGKPAQRAGEPPVTQARCGSFSGKATVFLRVTDSSAFRDGLSSHHISYRDARNAHRRLIPVNGSIRRALTALLEPWINGSCGCASGSTAATPTKRRAALASRESTAHNRSGVRWSAAPPAVAIGIAGDQKHLPD